MRTYNQASVEAANDILWTLLESQSIEGGPLYRSYVTDPEVREILRENLCPRSRTNIFEKNGGLYIVRDAEGPLLALESDRIKDRIKAKDSIEVYTAFFALHCLIGSFYQSDEPVCSREFVKVEELEKLITETLEDFAEKQPDMQKRIESKELLNFSGIAKYWLDLSAFEAGKDPRRTKTTRVDFILRACRLFEDEGYVKILGSDEIKIETRLQRIVETVYFNDERKSRLLAALHGSFRDPAYLN